MIPTIVDTVNDDGSVTRVMTMTNTTTKTFTAIEYKNLQISLANQIASVYDNLAFLQTQATLGATNVIASQKKVTAPVVETK